MDINTKQNLNISLCSSTTSLFSDQTDSLSPQERLNYSTAVPDEILTMIFSYLKIQDYMQMELVCRRWRDITCKIFSFKILKGLQIQAFSKPSSTPIKSTEIRMIPIDDTMHAELSLSLTKYQLVIVETNENCRSTLFLDDQLDTSRCQLKVEYGVCTKECVVLCAEAIWQSEKQSVIFFVYDRQKDVWSWHNWFRKGVTFPLSKLHEVFSVSLTSIAFLMQDGYVRRYEFERRFLSRGRKCSYRDVHHFFSPRKKMNSNTVELVKYVIKEGNFKLLQNSSYNLPKEAISIFLSVNTKWKFCVYEKSGNTRKEVVMRIWDDASLKKLPSSEESSEIFKKIWSPTTNRRILFYKDSSYPYCLIPLRNQFCLYNLEKNEEINIPYAEGSNFPREVLIYPTSQVFFIITLNSLFAYSFRGRVLFRIINIFFISRLQKENAIYFSINAKTIYKMSLASFLPKHKRKKEDNLNMFSEKLNQTK